MGACFFTRGPGAGPHPLALVGVLESQVVGERPHGDGQLADLLQLDGPPVSADDQRVHPPVCGLDTTNTRRHADTRR